MSMTAASQSLPETRRWFAGRFYYLSGGWCVDMHRRRLVKLVPNFVVIGAQKSGTSSLHAYLDQHPRIFMGDFKETNLFLEDSTRTGPYHALEPYYYGSSNRRKRYELSDNQILRRKLFGYAGQPFIGDASPYYTMAPAVGRDVPARMRRMNPAMKLIYILRNPLDRIVSNFLHDVSIHWNIGRPITDTFNERLASRPHLLDISLYHRQLSEYLKHFAPDRFKVVIFERFRDDPGQMLAEMLRFLGVEPADFEFDTSAVANVSAVRRRFEPEQLRFSRENYRRCMEQVEPDVHRLEQFLGHPIEQWDLSEERWCGSANNAVAAREGAARSGSAGQTVQTR